MKLVLPLVLALAGLLIGAGAGWFLRPAPVPENGVAQDAPEMRATPAPAEAGARDTLRLPNQFLVPVIADGRMRALVVIGLALELREDHDVSMDRHEARLRAAFLQAMFDHANLGGFDGMFTRGEVLQALQRTLRDIARAELGEQVLDVLITDLVRQES